jgi:hypothetical protein
MDGYRIIFEAVDQTIRQSTANLELHPQRSLLQSTSVAITEFCLFLAVSPRKKVIAHLSRHKRQSSHLVVQIAAKFV